MERLGLLIAMFLQYAINTVPNSKEAFCDASIPRHSLQEAFDSHRMTCARDNTTRARDRTGQVGFLTRGQITRAIAREFEGRAVGCSGRMFFS